MSLKIDRNEYLYVVNPWLVPFTNFCFPDQVLVYGISGRVAVSSKHFHVFEYPGLSILHNVNLLSVNCDGVEILRFEIMVFMG